MAHLLIYWTETAIKQRNFIFQYWNERNKSNTYTLKLNKKIKERINQLKTNPDIGKLTDFKNTRLISLGHYSVFYQKQSNRIFITGFWDNRQEPKKLLKFLKD